MTHGQVKVDADGTLSVAVAWWLRDEHDDWAPRMHNAFAKAEG
jgi:hypothetical protein